MRDLGIATDVKLKVILKIWGGKVLTGFMLLGIENSYGDMEYNACMKARTFPHCMSDC